MIAIDNLKFSIQQFQAHVDISVASTDIESRTVLLAMHPWTDVIWHPVFDVLSVNRAAIGLKIWVVFHNAYLESYHWLNTYRLS